MKTITTTQSKLNIQTSSIKLNPKKKHDNYAYDFRIHKLYDKMAELLWELNEIAFNIFSNIEAENIADANADLITSIDDILNSYIGRIQIMSRYTDIANQVMTKSLNSYYEGTLMNEIDKDKMSDTDIILDVINSNIGFICEACNLLALTVNKQTIDKFNDIIVVSYIPKN